MENPSRKMKMVLTLLVHQETKPEVSIPIRGWVECDIRSCTEILAQSHTLLFRSLNITNGDSGYSRISRCEPGTTRMQPGCRSTSSAEWEQGLLEKQHRELPLLASSFAAPSIIKAHLSRFLSCFPPTRFKHGLNQFGLQSFHCTWSPCTGLVIAVSNIT